MLPADITNACPPAVELKILHAIKATLDTSRTTGKGEKESLTYPVKGNMWGHEVKMAVYADAGYASVSISAEGPAMGATPGYEPIFEVFDSAKLLTELANKAGLKLHYEKDDKHMRPGEARLRANNRSYNGRNNGQCMDTRIFILGGDEATVQKVSTALDEMITERSSINEGVILDGIVHVGAAVSHNPAG